MSTRPLYEIASEIRKTWKNVHFAAKPYLDAMAHLDHIESNYGYDSAKMMILYFLSFKTSNNIIFFCSSIFLHIGETKYLFL